MNPGPLIPPAIHRVAAAGNAAVVLLLILTLANDRALFGEGARVPTPPAMASTPPDHARGVVLVVLDGLRADTTRDRATMPFLAAIHPLGTARVEGLLPSTVAAALTLTTGDVPPPAFFAQDFSTRASSRGGIFEAVAASGGKSFVAGPKLWTDLFGRWVADSHVGSAFNAADQGTLDAGLKALAAGRFRFLVIHLDAVDTAAHSQGADSPAYRRAAHAADDSVKALHAALPPGFAMVVTSDHGNIRSGGHVGPELDVLTTPLFRLGPGFDPARLHVRQRDVPDMILDALGLDPASTLGSAPPRRDLASLAWLALCGLGAGFAALRVWSAIAVDSRGSSEAFRLNLAVWFGLALTLLGHERLGLASLSIGAFAGGWAARGSSLPPALIASAAAGMLVGAFREGEAIAGGPWVGAFVALGVTAGGWAIVRDGVRPWSGLWAALPGYALGGPRLAGVGFLAFIVGKGMAHERRTPCLMGVLVGASPFLWSGMLGSSVSLSTVDVQAAYSVIDGPLGIELAAALVALGIAFPLIALMAGLAGRVRWMRPAEIGAFAATLAATIAGQGVVPALTLACPGLNQEWSALGLDGLLRVICEAVIVFLTLAAMALIPSLAVIRRRLRGARDPKVVQEFVATSVTSRDRH